MDATSSHYALAVTHWSVDFLGSCEPVYTKKPLKTHINTAPEAIRRNFLNRLHGTLSMAEGYLAALDYARTCHYDCDPYAPVYGVIAERLRATGDMQTFRTFVNAHEDELRLEQRCAEAYKKLSDWRNGPDAATVAARNQAAYQADQLEQAINARGEQLHRQREIAARAQAFTDARMELSK